MYKRELIFHRLLTESKMHALVGICVPMYLCDFLQQCINHFCIFVYEENDFYATKHG